MCGFLFPDISILTQNKAREKQKKSEFSIFFAKSLLYINFIYYFCITEKKVGYRLVRRTPFSARFIILKNYRIFIDTRTRS